MDVSYRRSLDRKIVNDIEDFENRQFLLLGEMNYWNLEKRNQAERMLDNLDNEEKEKWIQICLTLIGKNSELNRVYQHLLEEFYPYLITLHNIEDVLKGQVRIWRGGVDWRDGLQLYELKFPKTIYGTPEETKKLYVKTMTIVYELLCYEESFWEMLHKELIAHIMTVELPVKMRKRLGFKNLFSEHRYSYDDSKIPFYIEMCRDIDTISDGWSDKKKIQNICSEITMATSEADGCIFIMKDYSYGRVKNRTTMKKFLDELKTTAVDVLDISKKFLKSAANFCKRRVKTEGGRRRRKKGGKKRKRRTRKTRKKKRKSRKRRHTKKSRRR